MAHELKRFTKSLVYEPQLITRPLLEDITSYLEDRNIGEYIKAHEEASAFVDKQEAPTPVVSESKEIGLLHVKGNLTYKPTIFSALCGGTDYTTLLEQTKELCSMDNIHTIVMEVDSGGGMAFRMMETSREMRKLCDQSDKRLIAYVDGLSASAAFGLSVAAHEVIANPDSMIGSVGAVVALKDTSEKDKKDGVKTLYITSAESKVPVDEYGSFKEDYIKDVQQRVKDLGTDFEKHVASMRGISHKEVAATEAKVFNSRKALELGLVDKIMEGEEFYTYLADLSKEDSTPSKNVQTIKLENLQSTESKPMTDKVNTEATVDADLLAKLEKMEAAMNAQSEQLAAYQAKEVEAEKAALSAGLDKFAFLSEDKEAVVSFLSNEQVSAEHKELMHNILASAQASVETLKETMSNEVSEIQAALDQANVDKEKLKEEFGAKEIASTDVPEELSLTEKLQAKVDAKKATKAKKA